MKKDKYFQLALRENAKSKPDFQKMKQYFENSYRKGNFKAAYALGTWYLHGYHVTKDLSKGNSLIKIAAKAGIPEALYDLAVSYEKGAGIKKNLHLAYEYYLKAALTGDKQSLYEVGRCHFYGIGVTKNTKVGRIWLDKAKKEGVTK